MSFPFKSMTLWSYHLPPSYVKIGTETEPKYRTEPIHDRHTRTRPVKRHQSERQTFYFLRPLRRRAPPTFRVHFLFDFPFHNIVIKKHTKSRVVELFGKRPFLLRNLPLDWSRGLTLRLGLRVDGR